MKFIANLIVKSNQWYENLPDTKGEIFYTLLVFLPYIILMFFAPFGIFNFISGISWILLVCLWRLSFDWIKYRNKR